jgi:ornithine cyclodeaminase/alanine dehydrogenase-like protein (mu-crystallin family)
VLHGHWLSPGVHINAVGAPRPDWRELDDRVLGLARLYIDSREAAQKESGDVIAAEGVFAEIGEGAAGTKSGCQTPGEITLFKSLGLPVEDVVTAELVFQKATKDHTPDATMGQG